MPRKFDEERLKRNLAGNLTRCRLAMGLTSKELADLCGVATQQVTRSEHAEKMARSDLLAKWSLIFGVPADFLLFYPAEPLKDEGRDPAGFALSQRDRYTEYLRRARKWRRPMNGVGGRNGKH